MRRETHFSPLPGRGRLEMFTHTHRIYSESVVYAPRTPATADRTRTGAGKSTVLQRHRYAREECWPDFKIRGRSLWIVGVETAQLVFR